MVRSLMLYDYCISHWSGCQPTMFLILVTWFFLSQNPSAHVVHECRVDKARVVMGVVPQLSH